MRKLLSVVDYRGVIGLLLTLLLSININAQEWKATYNQALEKYKAEDYQNSLALAKDAFEKSSAETMVNRAYILQLITSNCSALEDADTGLKYSDQEISFFQQAEGLKSKSLAEAMKKQIIFMQQKGQIKQALEKSQTALKCFYESYGSTASPTVLFTIIRGDLFLATGDSTNAKKIWNEGLLSLAARDETKDEYKDLLYNTAALEENLKDYSGAEKKYVQLKSFLEKEGLTSDPLYEEAKKAAPRLQGKLPTASDGLEPLLKNALALQAQRQTAKAIEVYRQSTDLAIKNNAKDKTAFSLFFNYSRLLIDNDNMQAASEQLQKARSLASTLFSNTAFENFLIELTTADLYLAQGQKDKAVTQYNSLVPRLSRDIAMLGSSYVVASSNQLLNNDKPRAAVNLLRPLLCCLEENGALKESTMKVALTYSEAMLELNRPDSAILFLNQPFMKGLPIELRKVEALQANGQWTTAREKLIAVEAQATTDQSKGDVNYYRARLEHKMGDYALAESYYQKAIGYYEKANPADSWQASNSLATLYSRLGNFEKSEKIINEVLGKVPTTNPLHTSLLGNLAANYIEEGQLQKARAIQEKIVQLERETAGDNHPDYALALSNLAAVCQKEGKYSEARKLMEDALRISKSNFGDQSIDYGLKESNLGTILKDMGDYGNARAGLVHAEKVLAEKLGKSHPDYVSCEYNLALVLQRTGDLPQAKPLMQHLTGFYQKQILDFFPAMSEQEQVAFFNKINKAVQDYQQFVIDVAKENPELIGQLLDFRLATKALLLNSSVKIREQILNGGDQKLKSQFVQWLSLKEELGKLYNQEKNSRSLNEITRLESQANELEKNISGSSSIFKKGKDERTVNWKSVQSMLQPGEAAVEVIRVKASGKTDSITYAAVIVKKDSDPVLKLFRRGKNMEGREFSYYRNSIVFRLEDDRSYDVFWKPVESVLKNIARIYFSADGVYNKINLVTLHDPEKNEYLSKRYQFVLVSNLKDLASEGISTGEKGKAAQLFGPINFGQNTQPSNRILRSAISGISSLPGTRVEIERIDQLLKSAQWSSSSRIEVQASEHNIKSLQSPAILHIATHGFFIETDDESQVVMAGRMESENPLLRSGLIFNEVSAPANGEDGLLTSYEVKNLNFDKTDLVVLSACETGSGEIRNGEGVYGLQRAFLIAGANSVLMSLWKVDDEATQELMVLFYQNLLKGGNKSAALRSAQAELTTKYPDPFFWGSFVLIGKPN
ncbi:hypothetical protein WSM22_27030 [Cytophagales bacterium WSM2-2]|nr:hypothetical protein WSM22_27030 [Cytophagales bacterium WSM2-2]